MELEVLDVHPQTNMWALSSIASWAVGESSEDVPQLNPDHKLPLDLNDSFSGNTTALGLGDSIHGPSPGYSPAVQTKTTSNVRIAPFQSDTLSPIPRHDSKDIDPRLGSASPILLSSSLHAPHVYIDHRSLLLDSDSRLNDVDTLRREINKLVHNLSLANEDASTEREKVALLNTELCTMRVENEALVRELNDSSAVIADVPTTTNQSVSNTDLEALRTAQQLKLDTVVVELNRWRTEAEHVTQHLSINRAELQSAELLHRSTIDQLQQKIDTAATSFIVITERNKVLEANTIVLSTERDQLIVVNAELMDRNTTQSMLNSKLEASYFSMTTERDTLSQINVVLQSQLNTTKHTNVDLQSQMYLSITEHETAVAVNADLCLKMEHIEADTLQLRTSIQAMVAVTQTDRDKIDSLNAEIFTLTTTLQARDLAVVNLTNELQAETDRYFKLSDIAVQKECMFVEHAKTIVGFKKQIDEMSLAISVGHVTETQLEYQLNELHSDNAALKTAIVERDSTIVENTHTLEANILIIRALEAHAADTATYANNLAEHERTHTELCTVVQNMESQIYKLEAEIVTLELQLQVEKNVNRDRDVADIKDGNTRFAAVQVEVERLSEILRTKNVDVCSHQEELDRLNGFIVILQLRVDTQDQEISDATFRLAARLALIDELRETAEDSAAEATAMRHTIETSTAQLTEIQAAFDAANNSRRTDRYAIDAQLTTALAERADLETQLQFMKVSLSDAEQQSASLKSSMDSDVAVHANELQALTVERDSLLHENSDSASGLVALQQQYDDVYAQAQSFTMRRAIDVSDLTQAHAQLAEVSTRFADLKLEYAALNSSAEFARSEILGQQIKTLAQENEFAKVRTAQDQQCLDLNLLNSNLVQRTQSLQSDKLAMEDQILSLLHERDTLNSDLVNVRATDESIQSDLVQKLSILQLRCNALNHEHDLHVSQHSTLNCEIGSLRSERDHSRLEFDACLFKLEIRLSDEIGRCGNMQHDYDRVAVRCAALEAENDSLQTQLYNNVSEQRTSSNALQQRHSELEQRYTETKVALGELHTDLAVIADRYSACTQLTHEHINARISVNEQLADIDKYLYNGKTECFALHEQLKLLEAELESTKAIQTEKLTSQEQYIADQAVLLSNIYEQHCTELAIARLNSESQLVQNSDLVSSSAISASQLLLLGTQMSQTLARCDQLDAELSASHSELQQTQDQLHTAEDSLSARALQIVAFELQLLESTSEHQRTIASMATQHDKSLIGYSHSELSTLQSTHKSHIDDTNIRSAVEQITELQDSAKQYRVTIEKWEEAHRIWLSEDAQLRDLVSQLQSQIILFNDREDQSQKIAELTDNRTREFHIQNVKQSEQSSVIERLTAQQNKWAVDESAMRCSIDRLQGELEVVLSNSAVLQKNISDLHTERSNLELQQAKAVSTIHTTMDNAEQTHMAALVVKECELAAQRIVMIDNEAAMESLKQKLAAAIAEHLLTSHIVEHHHQLQIQLDDRDQTIAELSAKHVILQEQFTTLRAAADSLKLKAQMKIANYRLSLEQATSKLVASDIHSTAQALELVNVVTQHDQISSRQAAELEQANMKFQIAAQQCTVANKTTRELEIRLVDIDASAKATLAMVKTESDAQLADAMVRLNELDAETRQLREQLTGTIRLKASEYTALNSTDAHVDLQNALADTKQKLFEQRAKMLALLRKTRVLESTRVTVLDMLLQCQVSFAKDSAVVLSLTSMQTLLKDAAVVTLIGASPAPAPKIAAILSSPNISAHHSKIAQTDARVLSSILPPLMHVSVDPIITPKKLVSAILSSNSVVSSISHSSRASHHSELFNIVSPVAISNNSNQQRFDEPPQYADPLPGVHSTKSSSGLVDDLFQYFDGKYD